MADHVHGENCDHAHDDHKSEEDMPELENQQDAKNLNRGEKKCRKALLKLGMKQLVGITRVALKKRDGLIFVINDPEVLKSSDNANSFAVFGELRLEDPNSRLSQAEAKKFTEKPVAGAEAKPATKVEDKKTEDDSAPLSEEGLTAGHIDMVMQHASCTRNTAVRVLRESNDDMVAAVMKLTQ